MVTTNQQVVTWAELEKGRLLRAAQQVSPPHSGTARLVHLCGVAGMSTRRRNVSDDVITHTSPPLSFLQSKMSSRSGPGLRRRGSREDLLWIGWLSNPTMRPIQEQLEAETQEVRKMIKPIMDAENGLIKDLERFLGRRAVTELRRRELLHKRWTERVWLPIQRRVEDHFSGRSDHEGDRMRCLNADYIRHCNAKGFVSLDCYDPQEYDPFPLDCYKLQMPVLKDPLLMDSRERIREKRAVLSCITGRKYTREEVKELLSRFSPTAGKPPQTGPPQTFSSAYLTSISTTKETPLERGTKSSHRPNVMPYQIKATSTADGKCYKVCCWSSRRR